MIGQFGVEGMPKAVLFNNLVTVAKLHVAGADANLIGQFGVEGMPNAVSINNLGTVAK